MKKIYGSNEFSKITGISKPALMRMHNNGELVAKLNGRGHRTYDVDDFYKPITKDYMAKKGLEVPVDIRKAFVDIPQTEKPKLNLVEHSFDIALEEVTSISEFDNLIPGKVEKYIGPLEGLNIKARKIWKNTLPDLIELGTIHKSDLLTLKNYCATHAQIAKMEIELDEGSYLLGDEKINPLVVAIDKAKNSAKTLAISMCITTQGRKNIKIPEPVNEDEEVWAKALG